MRWQRREQRRRTPEKCWEYNGSQLRPPRYPSVLQLTKKIVDFILLLKGKGASMKRNNGKEYEMRNTIFRRSFVCLVAFVMALSMAFVSPDLTIQAQAANKVTVKSVKAVDSLTGSKTIYLAKGKKAKLKTTVNVTPNNAANKKVTFKSSNSKIASVSAKGVVTAKKVGTAKITVASKKNPKKKAYVTVKVLKGKVLRSSKQDTVI